jgi:ABC-2 type transport system permease protein
MSPRITAATALRVLYQLRRDPRTIAMVIVVPTLLLVLLRYLFDADPQQFDAVGAPVLGLFPFITMFLVTSITMLRERTTGTLERLMTLPLAKFDLLAGYGIAFGVLATLQAAISSVVALWLLGLDVQGSALAVVGLAVANALLGMALGLLVSAFARTEFQAVQFMPAVVMPQILLCGLFIPRADMASALDATAQALPLTYAYDALHGAAIGQDANIGQDAAIVVIAIILALALAAATLRRRTA